MACSSHSSRNTMGKHSGAPASSSATAQAVQGSARRLRSARETQLKMASQLRVPSEAVQLRM
eukprot:6179717-Pleurochrysis_carterae.AAC.3